MLLLQVGKFNYANYILCLVHFEESSQPLNQSTQDSRKTLHLQMQQKHNFWNF